VSELELLGVAVELGLAGIVIYVVRFMMDRQSTEAEKERKFHAESLQSVVAAWQQQHAELLTELRVIDASIERHADRDAEDHSEIRTRLEGLAPRREQPAAGG